MNILLGLIENVPLFVGSVAFFLIAVGLQFARISSSAFDTRVMSVFTRLQNAIVVRLLAWVLAICLVVQLLAGAWDLFALLPGDKPADDRWVIHLFGYVGFLMAAHVLLDFAAALIFGGGRQDIHLSVRGALSVAMLALFFSVISFVFYALPSLLAWGRSFYRQSPEEALA